MSRAGEFETVVIFATVYLGMILGGLPRLRLDRTGVALLGAIAVLGFGLMTPEAAAQAVHVPTIVLLFSFMVIAAQMRLGGFYGAVTRWVVALPWSQPALMGVVVVASAVLSAVFSNDIACLAVAPVLARACLQRRLDPVPYLLGLACAANIGSAATLIGNPQNMLIGEVLKLPFGTYLRDALPPVLAGLGVTWALLAWPLRGAAAQMARTDAGESRPRQPDPRDDDPPLDRWQTAKGLGVAGALVGLFLWGGWPRDVAALVGAGVLLLSQRFHTSRVMSLVDWELLVLFAGLFIVNAAFAKTGLAAQGVAELAALGWQLNEPFTLMGLTLVLSNLVSNVPAVMLLLPHTQGASAGPTLALISTLAGNLFIVGSIANIIVVDAARREGIEIDWRRHARTGLPVTVLTLALAAGWLVWRA